VRHEDGCALDMLDRVPTGRRGSWLRGQWQRRSTQQGVPGHHRRRNRCVNHYIIIV